MTRAVDITAQRFGRLVAVEATEYRSSSGIVWECACDCGGRRFTPIGSLRSGKTRSCGCLAQEQSLKNLPYSETHGLSWMPEYSVWNSMIARCHRPRTKHYENYGGRGIVVCARWRDSFPAFLEDMGARLSPAHSIDRIDSDGPYEPGNCRWVTRDIQNGNTSRSCRWSYDGRTRTAVEWAIETGIDSKLLRHRIQRCGWTVERALTTPVKVSARKRSKPAASAA